MTREVDKLDSLQMCELSLDAAELEESDYLAPTPFPAKYVVTLQKLVVDFQSIIIRLELRDERHRVEVVALEEKAVELHAEIVKLKREVYEAQLKAKPVGHSSLLPQEARP